VPELLPGLAQPREIPSVSKDGDFQGHRQEVGLCTRLAERCRPVCDPQLDPQMIEAQRTRPRHGGRITECKAKLRNPRWARLGLVPWRQHRRRRLEDAQRDALVDIFPTTEAPRKWLGKWRAVGFERRVGPIALIFCFKCRAFHADFEPGIPADRMRQRAHREEGLMRADHGGERQVMERAIDLFQTAGKPGARLRMQHAETDAIGLQLHVGDPSKRTFQATVSVPKDAACPRYIDRCILAVRREV
jgi:hypothetical protein